MRIHFLGANRQVTGSCYCLEAAGQRLLVDCGLYQERPYLHRNWEPLPIAAESLNAMVLTMLISIILAVTGHFEGLNIISHD